MEIKFKTVKWIMDQEGPWLKILCPDRQQVQEFVQSMAGNEEQYIAKIDKERKKRSLDANSALWHLLSQMAGVLQTSKDELYLKMLDRYGVFTHIVVKASVVDKVKKEWKLVRELGEVTVMGENGRKQTGIQLQCYFGSHSYDSKEFATLLDGTIEEAKELGIYFISREDRDRMIREWGA